MSSSRHHGIRVAGACAIIALVLTACPDPPTVRTPSARPSEGEEPRPGGTLRVALASDVDSLDPHRAATPASWFFARAVHRGLYAYPAEPAPAGAEPVPDLATGLPALSADRRTATIALRSDARFGKPAPGPVLAADVRASIQRLRRAGVGITAFLGVIASVATAGDRTVVIHLSRPAPNLAWLLAHPQLAVLPRRTPAPPAPPSRIASAGPYVVSSYEPERRILLARNDAWARDADPIRGAWVDRIEASIRVPPVRAEQQVRSGAIDLVLDPGPPDAIPPPADDALVVRATTTCLRYLFLNTDVSPFADRLVRTAVAHAVDRDAVARIEHVVAAPTLLAPGIVGHSTEPVIEEDLAAARRSLRAAGRADGFATTLVIGATARDRGEAAAVRASLGRVGIRVRVREVPAASLYPLYYESRRAAVPMGLATWCADWPGLAGDGALAIADQRRGDRLVYSHLRSRRVTDAIDGAGVVAGADAADAWRRADTAALATAALIPLARPVERSVVPARLRGWTATPMFPRGDPTAIWLGAGGEA